MQRIFRNIGFVLVLLGASSFIFPMFGWRSKIMSTFGEHERIAAIASLVVGGVLFALSFRKQKEEKK